LAAKGSPNKRSAALSFGREIQGPRGRRGLNHGTKRDQCIGDSALHPRDRCNGLAREVQARKPKLAIVWMDGNPACRRSLSAALIKEHGPWAVCPRESAPY